MKKRIGFTGKSLVWALFFAFTSYGCVPPPVPPPQPEAKWFDIETVKPEEHNAYISKFEEQKKKTTDKKEVAKLNYALYELYSCHMNSKRDYKKALSAMNDYIASKKPEKPSYMDMQMKDLLEIIIKLQSENKDLKAAIEQIEKLDKRMHDIKKSISR
ncbi:MAG: hypothetical protein OEV59_06420 [Deltaproteobacteria bacterium]|nr:hypothetical protein [Deltaproteobacteria bacterium]